MTLARHRESHEGSHSTIGLGKAWPRVSQGGAENPHARHWMRPEMPMRPPQRPAANAAVKVVSVLGLLALGCANRPVSLRQTADAGSNCATVGCSAPPLCSQGCTAPCGCCLCTPGERSGDLVCTDQGCYGPVAAAPDAGILVACSGEGDPLCGQGSSCIGGCPLKGGGGLCSVAGRETCGCGIIDQPCTTPGLECLYPSCCDYQGLCLTPDERQTVCAGPLAAKFNCAPAVGSPDAGSGAGSDGGWTAAPACSLPFAQGPCDAASDGVYAFVGGSCVARTYGGCQGNANRFSTLEECMAICEGRPTPFGCPSGRTAQQICLACGAAGGCAKSMMVCAVPCAPASTTCTVPNLPTCFAGVCQNAYCD